MLLLHNHINLIELLLFSIRFWSKKIFARLRYLFFINPAIKRIIIAFPFSLYFFNSKLFLICVLQFFFVKRSKNFFVFSITYAFCKNVFTIWYINIITNFKFSIFIVSFSTRVNICVWFYINRFYFKWYVLLYLLIASSNLSIYSIFLISNSYTYEFCSLKL